MYSLQPFLLGGREKAEIGPVVGMGMDNDKKCCISLLVRNICGR